MPDMNKKIIIIGSVALDSIKTLYGERKEILGGSATFSSLSASMFNRNVTIVAVIGEDFPKKYLGLISSRGIDLSGLEIVKGGKTFRWAGDYCENPGSPKTIYTHLNVFKDFNPVVPCGMRKTPFVFLANIDPDLQDMVLKQMKSPELVLCDTMNYWIMSKKKALLKLIGKTDIFLLNDGEARMLSGENNIIKAAKFVISRGAKAVIIKQGAHGAMYFTKSSSFSAPAYPLEADVCDPTGAGDTFAGGFMGYISSQRKITETVMRRAICYGTIMASYAVSDFSVNALLKAKRNNVEKRFREFSDFTRF